MKPLKKRLLTPGPTTVPEETLLEMAKPVFYHRSPEFRQLLAEVTEGLQYVFCTKNPVITLTCSGTGGLEAALVNCVPPGGKVICLIAGRFGERWRSLCRAFHLEAVSISVPLGQSVQPEQLSQAMAAHPDAVAVCATLSETSTGAAHDIASFGKRTAPTRALLLVDAVSGLGVMECRTDEWGIDVCVTGSQKALMLPPGLAFLSVSERAWKAMEANRQAPAYYFDLRRARKSLETHDTPFTPAHTLVRALRLSLQRIRDEGLENIWAYHARNAAAAQAGFRAMGLEVFPAQPAPGLTVVRVPSGVDATELLRRLESNYGIKLANGQDELKGKIIRLGHMGYVDQFDVLAALAGVELVLHEMGQPVEPGCGLAAAQRVYAAGERGL
jgi:aspartate aminotransferase-like enzyme